MASRQLLLLLSMLVSISSAHAYPSFIRLGYVSCTACHYLATGGGLLTPYGKTISASEAFFAREINPSDQAINQGVHVRLLEQGSNAQANPFLMQADYLNSSFITKQVRIDGVFGGALYPGPHGTWVDAPGGWDAFLIRRFLVTGIIDDENSIQMGRDYYPQGLNIDDHTSLLKSYNKRNVTDYPTQLRFIHQGERWQLIPYLYGPSYEELADNQEQGLGVRGEYALGTSNSVGGIAQFGDTPALSRVVGDGFARLSQASWNGLMSEFVFEHRQVHQVSATLNQLTWYTEGYVTVPEWVETGFVWEILHVSDPNHQVSTQYGPRMNIRVCEWFSLLGDARNSATNGVSNWIYYGQAFLHLQI
jgi:hypothetical protein